VLRCVRAQLLTHVAAEVQVPLLLAGPTELHLGQGAQTGIAAGWKQTQITFRHGEYGEVVALVPTFEAGCQILDLMREGLVLQTGTVQARYDVLSALPPVCFANMPRTASVESVSAAVDRAIGAAMRGLHLPERECPAAGHEVYSAVVWPFTSCPVTRISCIQPPSCAATESQVVRVMLLPDQASAVVFVRSRGAYDALTSAGNIEVRCGGASACAW